ncbi:MAG: efflux transporter outer membrane subunit [Ferrovum sp.]|nr:efflux transporter outer membrane subunit [Ferrovum sp.]NDU86809.1 efflux transporter outer membrane subunit [Ferrovum sp.]
MTNKRSPVRLWAILGMIGLGGCAVGPDYVKPSTVLPASFRIPPGWKVATPQDPTIPAQWWQMFQDPTLDQLEVQVAQANQTLAQQEAAWRQSQALVQSTQAGLFPTLNAAAGESRTRASAGAIGLAQGLIYNNDQAALQANWVPDLWGSVRRSIEANQATSLADANQIAATLLTLQSQLAVDYFQLRADDAQRALLRETVKSYQQSLDLTVERKSSGVAADTDVLLAENLLESAKAQLIDVEVQRSQMEHAIAVLIGKAPSDFELPESPLGSGYPQLPVSLPSALLERRPDIAVAERQAAAASAQIGVAQAAFYPTITLTGSYGYQNKAYSNLFSVPNHDWSLSPQILQPLFDAGLREANLNQARAGFDQAVANYREVVLVAFQNVEDNLSAEEILTREIGVQQKAVHAAARTVDLTDQQYRAGTVGYLNVITAETALLTGQVTEVSLRGRAFIAAVQLITALGGGWQVQQPPADGVH